MSRTELSIKTFIRIRPPGTNCIFRDPSDEGVLNCCDKLYRFNHVFAPEATDEQIFERIGFQLVENTLNGLNSTLFAYGQTGTGKTYTMTGNSVKEGLVQRCVGLLIRTLVTSPRIQSYSLRINYLEIYNETIRDLLAEKQAKIVIRQLTKSGFYVQGLQAVEIQDAEAFSRELKRGLLKRSTKSTKMNEVSSRSHTILTVFLETKTTQGEGCVVRESKLNFVDLAGSEKQKQTDVSGSKLKEASSINKSLTTLSLVISKLAEKAKGAHVPYRESVLTKVLKDSIGGNSMTTFIGMVSAQKAWLSETLSTLLFLQRLKSVKNVVEVNEKIEGKEEELIKKIATQQQRIKNLEEQLVQAVRREEIGKNKIEQLQIQLEQAQIQVSELQQRLLEQPFNNFFTNFGQVFDQQQASSSLFEEPPQEIDFCSEKQGKLSTVNEQPIEAEQVAEQRILQTEVKSKKQENLQEVHRTASVKGSRRQKGKSHWQLQCEFLRQEIKKYAQEDIAYCDFVQLIRDNIANFQFATAQILILQAQAQRLKRTEEHLKGYRAKFAQMTALVQREQTQFLSQLSQVRSIELDSINKNSQIILSQNLLQQEIDALRAKEEDFSLKMAALQEKHRIQIFKLQEQNLSLQETQRKIEDQLQFMKDENARLAQIVAFYQEGSVTSTYTTEEQSDNSTEAEKRRLRIKVRELEEIIEKDFLSTIEDLQLQLKAKNKASVSLNTENQLLRQNICALEVELDELRLKCSECEAAITNLLQQRHKSKSENFFNQGQEVLSFEELKEKYEKLQKERKTQQENIQNLRADLSRMTEEMQELQQRLRNQKQAHRQAQTFFRHELKVKDTALQKARQEWLNEKRQEQLKAKHKQEQASQLAEKLQQLLDELTAEITFIRTNSNSLAAEKAEIEKKLQDIKTQAQRTQKQQKEIILQLNEQLKSLDGEKKQLEECLRIEQAHLQDCIKDLMKANKLYRSEQCCYYRFKAQYRDQLKKLRRQNRRLLEEVNNRPK